MSETTENCSDCAETAGGVCRGKIRKKAGFIRMSIIMRFPEGKEKAFTMSYDDGVAQDIRLAEIMKKNGLHGTFNINAGLIAAEDAQGGAGKMSAAQIKALYSDPSFEVAVHGYTHPSLAELSADEIIREVMQDKQKIEEMFGVVVRGMAYPYGCYNETVIACLRLCGIAYSRTTVSTENYQLPEDWLRLPATCHHNCARLNELGDAFIAWKMCPSDAPQMFYLWGHSYEFDTHNNWDVIEKFAEKIGGHDDIWYATNIEICDYVDAFRRLHISTDGRIIENPTSSPLWFTYKDNTFRIDPGAQIKLD